MKANTYAQHSQPCNQREDGMNSGPSVGLWWLLHHSMNCWHGRQNEITCMYWRDPLLYICLGCVRLMRCNLSIANMAHFSDTDRPCFPPVVHYVWSWKAACDVRLELTLYFTEYKVCFGTSLRSLSTSFPCPSLHSFFSSDQGWGFFY